MDRGKKWWTKTSCRQDAIKAIRDKPLDASFYQQPVIDKNQVANESKDVKEQVAGIIEVPMTNRRDRDKIIKSLGHADYKDYLQSERWLNIRERVLARDKIKCRSCGAMGMQAHHISYDEDTMLGKNIDKIVCLCRDCHRSTEFCKIILLRS
jgi:5-methylcytosine-specific restriction endonuclease McrA